MFLLSKVIERQQSFLLFAVLLYAFFTLLACSNQAVTPKLSDIPLHSNKKYVSIESLQAELNAEALKQNEQKRNLLKE